MTPYSYDRVLKTALAEVEAGIVAMVDRAFEGLPLDAEELPIIGGWPFLGRDRDEQRQLAIAALRARRWFEFEAPLWAQPLPLTDEDCVALFNGPHQGNRRSWLRGEYGLHARTLSWNTANMRPFEKFCALG